MKLVEHATEKQQVRTVAVVVVVVLVLVVVVVRTSGETIQN